MSRRAYGRLAARLTLLKLRRSPTMLAVSLALPALAAFAWAAGSYASGLRTFLFLLPHGFLFATQNMFRGEAAGGTLENVLFVDGGFRGYFLRKNVVLAACGCGYGILVYILFAAVSPGGSGPALDSMPGLAASLAAGIYYVAFGGLLGQFLEGGANVLAVILLQAAAFVGLIQDAAGGNRFLESLASGAFSTSPDRLKFAAIAAAVPNILVSRSLLRYAWWTLPAAALLFLVQAFVLRKRELLVR